MKRFDVFFEWADCATSVLDQIEGHTSSHAVNVAALATGFAHSRGAPVDDQRDLFFAALLHDVGETTVPFAIFHKQGRLSHDERRRMETHAAVGGRIVGDIPGLEGVGDLIRHHHESWDGTGYPDRLLEGEFGETAQILAVCDMADTLGRDRPYRKGLGAEEIAGILRQEAGKRFSEEVVSSFLDWAPVWREDKASFDRRTEIRDASPDLDADEAKVYLLALAIVLADLVGQKIPYLAGHAAKVALLADQIARGVGMDDEARFDLKLACFLCDVGVLAQPESLYLTRGRVDDDGRQEIERHPVVGEEAVARLSSRPGLGAVVRHHHEAWDGSGYPDGITGDEIPMAARVVRLADTYVALQHRRPWRRAQRIDGARESLRTTLGSILDPSLLDLVADFAQ